MMKVESVPGSAMLFSTEKDGKIRKNDDVPVLIQQIKKELSLPGECYLLTGRQPATRAFQIRYKDNEYRAAMQDQVESNFL
jgi:hypothetical protein